MMIEMKEVWAPRQVESDHIQNRNLSHLEKAQFTLKEMWLNLSN